MPKMHLVGFTNDDGVYVEEYWTTQQVNKLTGKAGGRPPRETNQRFTWLHFMDWRKKRRYSYRSLAAQLGVSRQTIASWENQVFTMPLNIVDRLKAVDVANGYDDDFWASYDQRWQ